MDTKDKMIAAYKAALHSEIRRYNSVCETLDTLNTERGDMILQSYKHGIHNFKLSMFSTKGGSIRFSFNLEILCHGFCIIWFREG